MRNFVHTFSVDQGLRCHGDGNSWLVSVIRKSLLLSYFQKLVKYAIEDRLCVAFGVVRMNPHLSRHGNMRRILSDLIPIWFVPQVSN